MVESTVIVRRTDDEPLINVTPRSHFVWLARASEAGEAFALQHWTTAPGGPWVPLHRHLFDDEAFYVFEGEMEFEADGRRFTAPAGTWVFIPREVVHTLRAIGEMPARYLVLLAPGRFGEWFEKTKTAEIHREYGWERVGDPPVD
jgi:quercetin dioxygenase-like cupin family protein